MTEKHQLTFSHKYTKLTHLIFTTVRWTDAVYRLGKLYDIIYVVPSSFHRRIKLGEAKIISMELKRLGSLTDEFIRKDADCDREEFMKLMVGWYQGKPDWQGEESTIQVLTCMRTSLEKPSKIMEQEDAILQQQQLVTA